MDAGEPPPSEDSFHLLETAFRGRSPVGSSHRKMWCAVQAANFVSLRKASDGVAVIHWSIAGGPHLRPITTKFLLGSWPVWIGRRGERPGHKMLGRTAIQLLTPGPRRWRLILLSRSAAGTALA
jgi:hypothetical protein